MACGTTSSPVTKQLHPSTTVEQFEPFSSWQPAVGLDKVKMVVKRRSVNLAGTSPVLTLKPVYRIAAVRPDDAGAWNAITGQSGWTTAVNNTGTIDISAYTAGQAWIQWGIAYTVSGSGTLDAQAPTWEEVREAWMAGTGLGALPEGDWRPSPPAPWKHHRKAGDTPDLGAKVTDCSGCPSEREEVPCTAESTTDCRGCNQEVTATGAWEPDGAGGCIRSLTCTDYTAYCSGIQASAADADVVCGCATGAYTATVYVDGECRWYGECSCGGTATATYGQNPNGNASATVTEVADGSCGGAKVDPGWAGRKPAPPLREVGEGECRYAVDTAVRERTLTGSSPAAGNVRLSSPLLSVYDPLAAAELVDIVGSALGLLAQDADLVDAALCLYAPGCRTFIGDVLAGRWPQDFVIRTEPSDFDRMNGATSHGHGRGFATDRGDTVNVFWGPGTTLHRAWQEHSDGSAVTDALLELAGLLLHELIHVCDPNASDMNYGNQEGVSDPTDFWRDGRFEGLSTTYYVADEYTRLATSRYGL